MYHGCRLKICKNTIKREEWHKKKGQNWNMELLVDQCWSLLCKWTLGYETGVEGQLHGWIQREKSRGFSRENHAEFEADGTWIMMRLLSLRSPCYKPDTRFRTTYESVWYHKWKCLIYRDSFHWNAWGRNDFGHFVTLDICVWGDNALIRDIN